MRERRDRLRFAFEAGDAFRIGGKEIRKDLDGDVSTEPSIAGAIHFAHSARPERAADFVGAETSTRVEWQAPSPSLRACGPTIGAGRPHVVVM